MTFEQTKFEGLLLVDAGKSMDSRGFFSRIYSPELFEEAGVDSSLHQVSISMNLQRGTLRGMHYQHPPMGEIKLVRVVKGSIFDVAVDLRPNSPTFLQWFGTELSDANFRAVYIPKGFAHGFMTLEDNSQVLYQISNTFSPEHSNGFRWDDAAIGIVWPLEPLIISQRDRNWPKLPQI